VKRVVAVAGAGAIVVVTAGVAARPVVCLGGLVSIVLENDRRGSRRIVTTTPTAPATLALR
jgi:hypothetical protein